MKIMKIMVEIDTSNAAFEDDGKLEIEMLLEDVAESVQCRRYDSGDWENILLDSNGNRCGWVRGKL
jgi:hypothetical protein